MTEHQKSKIGEIDAKLNDLLPDKIEDVTPRDVAESRRDEMIELLQYTADELGKSPSMREYDEFDFETSASQIKRAFGTWNDAKREAGLAPLSRGEGTVVDINEDYFSSINTTEKAYWLGSLFPISPIVKQQGGMRIQITRTTSKDHFVRNFRQAIDSEHSVSEYSTDRPNEQNRVSIAITNPTFTDNLLSAGYPGVEEPAGGFPPLSEEYWPAFVRGYLESGGYFSTGGWRIPTDTESRAEKFYQLFEQFGGKSASISENTDSGAAVVNISNIFDIKSVFEACWPDHTDTTPSWTPYPQKILDYLEEEYPYPENVSYIPE